MKLTVNVTYTCISSQTVTQTQSTERSFTLTLKACTDTPHFSAPTAPTTKLLNRNNVALDLTLYHDLNVLNSLPFYIGAFTSLPCDFKSNCCTLTYSGQAKRTTGELISGVNGGVEILTINQTTRQIAANQLNSKRSPLANENFIQNIVF